MWWCFLQENVDPELQAQSKAPGEQQTQRRALTVEDEHDIWRDITLTQYANTAEDVCLVLIYYTVQ